MVMIEERANGKVSSPKKADKAPALLKLADLRPRTVVLRIVGDEPLITHAWSEKAKKEMRDNQQGTAESKAKGREPKDPIAEYEGAFYHTADGKPAIPTIAFKAAVVNAARQVEGFTMVFLRGAFRVEGELTEIISEPPIMREDMVRVGMGKADMRYRPEFRGWSVYLTVKFIPNPLTLDQLISLFNLAGFACGVGEWRPEKNGQFGTFHVEDIGEVT